MFKKLRPQPHKLSFLNAGASKGKNGLAPEFSADHLFNKWAGINFLSTALADMSPVPQIYAGDKTEGFFVIEDFGDIHPLKETLWGGDPSKAAQAMIHYGEMLGLLHGKTASRFDTYTELQHQLNTNFYQPTENYLDFFQEPIKTLKRLG